MTKACTVVFMKVRNSLIARCRKKHVNRKKETEDRENLFFKALTNRLCVTSKSCSQFNIAAYGRPTIKWTS